MFRQRQTCSPKVSTGQPAPDGPENILINGEGAVQRIMSESGFATPYRCRVPQVTCGSTVTPAIRRPGALMRRWSTRAEVVSFAGARPIVAVLARRTGRATPVGGCRPWGCCCSTARNPPSPTSSRRDRHGSDLRARRDGRLVKSGASLKRREFTCMTWRCTPPILVYWLPAGHDLAGQRPETPVMTLSATAVRIGAAPTRLAHPSHPDGSLFDGAATPPGEAPWARCGAPTAPPAVRMRPRTLDEIIGQHLSATTPPRRLISADRCGIGAAVRPA